MFWNFLPRKFCENGMTLHISDQCSLSIPSDVSKKAASCSTWRIPPGEEYHRVTASENLRALAEFQKILRFPEVGASAHRYSTPAVIYLFKVNSGNTRAICEICSKIINKDTMSTSLKSLYDAFVVNFAQIPHIVLKFPQMTLKKYISAGTVE